MGISGALDLPVCVTVELAPSPHVSPADDLPHLAAAERATYKPLGFSAKARTSNPRKRCHVEPQSEGAKPFNIRVRGSSNVSVDERSQDGERLVLHKLIPHLIAVRVIRTVVRHLDERRLPGRARIAQHRIPSCGGVVRILQISAEQDRIRAGESKRGDRCPVRLLRYPESARNCSCSVERQLRQRHDSALDGVLGRRDGADRGPPVGGTGVQWNIVLRPDSPPVGQTQRTPQLIDACSDAPRVRFLCKHELEKVISRERVGDRDRRAIALLDDSADPSDVIVIPVSHEHQPDKLTRVELQRAEVVKACRLPRLRF
jgi:hypothetical protein